MRNRFNGSKGNRVHIGCMVVVQWILTHHDSNLVGCEVVGAM